MLIPCHIGIATKDYNKTTALLRFLGYEVGDIVFDPEQSINLIMCHHPSSIAIEVVFDRDNPATLSNILKNQSEQIYHICFKTDNLQTVLKELKKHVRVLPLSSSKPAKLFGGKPVSFYKVDGLGIVEFLEEK